jgi:serine O-acetyltransferase
MYNSIALLIILLFIPLIPSDITCSRDNEGQILRKALWDEQHFNLKGNNRGVNGASPSTTSPDPPLRRSDYAAPPYPRAFYPDIDLSIPDSVYSDDVDLVWDLLRWEAYENQQQQHEPLLVSFLHSTILNHDSLESSLAFLLANRLQSPAMMISTQLQALILSALQECPSFRRKLRADIMAVRDRDPACHTLPDVFLYFKGFHALQSHRTAHVLWQTGRRVLAQYLQSQVSQIFQIDIHPNATIGSGIMLDHGTGIVIGETVGVLLIALLHVFL